MLIQLYLRSYIIILMWNHHKGICALNKEGCTSWKSLHKDFQWWVYYPTPGRSPVKIRAQTEALWGQPLCPVYFGKTSPDPAWKSLHGSPGLPILPREREVYSVSHLLGYENAHHESPLPLAVETNIYLCKPTDLSFSFYPTEPEGSFLPLFLGGIIWMKSGALE